MDTTVTTALTLVLMIAAGILGAYCRHIFDQDVENFGFLKITVPGIVASFLVPLFLNIGRSDLLKNVLQGGPSYIENGLVLFSFCLLAAVSARSFVNALANQAFQKAERAEATATEAKVTAAQAKDRADDVTDIVAESVEVKKEDSKIRVKDFNDDAPNEFSERVTAEKLDEKLADVNIDGGTATVTQNDDGTVTVNSIFPPGSNLGQHHSKTSTPVDRYLASETTAVERAVLDALLNGNYARRSISGIARAIGCDKIEVRQALQSLMKHGRVVESRSTRTGSLLYQAKLN